MRRASVFVIVGAVIVVVAGFAIDRVTRSSGPAVQRTAQPPALVPGPLTGGPCHPAPGTLPARPKSVPDVRGLPLCQAMRRVEAHGFGVVFTQRNVPAQVGLHYDGRVHSQSPRPGSRSAPDGVLLVVLRPPVPPATVGLDCRPENAAFVFAAQSPAGVTNEDLVPRWIPVIQPHPPNGFAGCMPREFLYSDIDHGETVARLWGDQRPEHPAPIFGSDGTLLGYVISAAGYVPLNVIRHGNLVPESVIARTPTYAWYRAHP